MTETGMGAFRAAVANSRNSLIPYYLMASYAYYHRDTPFLDDATFDQLCKDLDAEFDGLDHMHKHLVDRDALKAGTCLLERKAFPTICKSAACKLAGLPWDPADNPGVVINIAPAPPPDLVTIVVSGGPPPGSAPATMAIAASLPPARVRTRTRSPA